MSPPGGRQQGVGAAPSRLADCDQEDHDIEDDEVDGDVAGAAEGECCGPAGV